MVAWSSHSSVFMCAGDVCPGLQADRPHGVICICSDNVPQDVGVFLVKVLGERSHFQLSVIFSVFVSISNFSCLFEHCLVGVSSVDESGVDA